MKRSDQPVNLDRCVLGGLFTGIITSIIAMVFNVIYRRETALYDYGLITPVSLFMAYPFFNLVAGGIYYLFVGHLRRGGLLFAAAMVALMAGLIFITAYSGTSGTVSKHQARELLIGFEIIQGIFGATLIPFFVNHPTLYLTPKDIRGEE